MTSYRSAARSLTSRVQTSPACSSAREGTLGIVTKIIVRLLRLPEIVVTQLALFKSVEDAAETVSGIIAAVILRALEL